MSDDNPVPAARVQQAERELEFFDRYVMERGDYDVLGEAAYRRLVQDFTTRISPRSGERCIDLGCGTGAFVRRLRHLGLDLMGMDISPAAIAFANQRATSERYLCGDITNSNLAAGSVDIIVYSGVLHHFPSRVDRARVLQEGFRLLAPGGRVFAFDPNLYSPAMWLYRHPRSPLFSSKGKTDNEVLLRNDELAEELAAAGFTRVEVQGASGITFNYVESAGARFILPLYNIYELLMRYSPFERRLGTFLVSTARKPGG